MLRRVILARATASIPRFVPAETGAAYGSWGTLVWGGIALILPFAIVAFCYQYFLNGDPALNEPMFMLAQLGSIAVVISAIWLRGWNVVDYLSLNIPDRQDVFLGIACVTILMVIELIIGYFRGQLHWLSAHFHPVPFLILALVTTPLSEELVHRGFMYRGLANSVVGPAGTIVFLALIFTGQHNKGSYISIFCFGLLVGWLRWRTNSVSISILVHAAANFSLLLLRQLGYGWITFSEVW